MKRQEDKLFHEYCKRQYLDFIDKVGSENYPVHNDDFTLDDLSEDQYKACLDSRGIPEYFCFIIRRADYIQFVKFTSTRGGVVWAEWDCNKLRRYFDNNRKLFKHYAEQYEDINWSRLDGILPEFFAYDFEQIDENGILEKVEYFPDNSIKSRQLIDLDTGELLYHRIYYKSSFYDQDLQRDRSSVNSFYLFDNYYQSEKEYIAEKTPVKKVPKWRITYPEKWKGVFLEDLYFKKYGKRK